MSKKEKIGNSWVTLEEYRDFYTRYDTIETTLNQEKAQTKLKELKQQGYKTKYKTVNMVDLIREYVITIKAIKRIPETPIYEYDSDIIKLWLKW